MKAPAWNSNPRWRRALRLLLKGPAMRRDIDEQAGVLNGPELIRQLRAQLGLQIQCVRVLVTDRDGQPCRTGRYELSKEDRRIVRRMLNAERRGN